MTEPGHNSRRGIGNGEAVAADVLRSFVQRVERLNEEKRALSADISEVFKEARDVGFDVKVLRLLISRRKKDQADLQEQEALLELYLSALGDMATTPLGEAAIGRVRSGADA